VKPAVLACLLLAAANAGCAVGITGFPTQTAVDGAIVGGQVVGNQSGPADYWVQYGPTTAYGSETARASVDLESGTPEPVTVQLGGLARDSLYHYRLCAQDAVDGPACGGDRTLRTQDVACGETVTADLRLTGNLECGVFRIGPQVGPNGIVIGADGIEVNLAGHTITGATFVGGDGTIGIDVGGFDGVTVRNGGIGLYGIGVHLGDAANAIVAGVDAQGSPYGLQAEGATNLVVRNGDVSGRDTGLLLDGVTGATIANVSAAGSFGGAISLSGSASRVVDSDARGGLPTSFGIVLAGSGNRVARTRVTGAGSRGGIYVGGADAAIVENEVSGTVLLDMSTSAENGDGIHVAGPGGLLRGNRAHDNGGDGIDVRVAGTRLGDNAATGNTLFGIRAVPGVIDLGGNSASGNGGPFQCQNVFCS
jgi:hypothetical protein